MVKKRCIFFLYCFAFFNLSLLSPIRAATVGDIAPDISLPGLRAEDGTGTINLADFRGKVVYLDFWASWCAPCVVSIPLLNELQNKHTALGSAFAVVAINVDSDPADGKDFLLDEPVQYKVLSDPTGITPKLFGVKGMPTSYLLDKEGKVHLVHEGFKRSDIDMIEAEIQKLLATIP
jgi:thiol-disulfide isomerase/thioredoxin